MFEDFGDFLIFTMSVISVIVFVITQGEICSAMPEVWFTSFVAEVFCVCAIFYYKR